MDIKRGGRPVRGSALRANQVWSENATNGYSSGGDDDVEAIKLEARQVKAQRSVPVVKQGVELGKLEVAALQRYRKFFRLGDASPNCSKDDLISGVARHFSNLVVEEEAVLTHFVTALQRQAKARSSHAQGGVHKAAVHKGPSRK